MSAKHFHPDDFEALVKAARCPSSGGAQTASDVPTPMVDAVLREIAEHMQAVAGGVERRVVTLRGLPIGPADYRVLRETLGTGEARVEVTLGGVVEAQETAFAGVWWVKNSNDEGLVLAEEIEIARAPMILAADRDDIRAGASALSARLASRTASEV